MESGAFAGAPAEAEQPQTPTEPVTPEQVAAEMDEAEAQPQEQASAEQESGSSQIDDMRRAFQEVLDQREESPASATGLLDALNEEEEAELEEPQGAEQQGAGEFEDPAAQQQMEFLRGLIREEAQQLVAPIQSERRDEALGAIERKYPDITSESVMSRLKPEIAKLVQLSGNESLKDHPTVVLLAYKAVKAEMADADAVPAETAAQQGASLETHSGVGNAQAGEPSVEDIYKQRVYGTHARSEL